uniref:Aminotransferase class V domain-containing protein n=1 Tax=Chaetoceros debilis TaxID=122233 RepID=A0A7S3Q7M5_9STRA
MQMHKLIIHGPRQYHYHPNLHLHLHLRASRKLQNLHERSSHTSITVIEHMVNGISHRHRNLIGSKAKEDARATMMTILGGDPSTHTVFLGANATSLFHTLAERFVESGYLRKGDEVVLASENHMANVIPWQRIAKRVGAKIFWWTRRSLSETQCANLNLEYGTRMSTDLDSLLTVNTRIVCLSHASNVLGSIRDIGALCQIIRRPCPNVQVVVDGVAACAHLYTDVATLGVDWYVVSCHKLFGPHVGAMCGRTEAAIAIHAEDSSIMLGTVNYEGCSGIVGLGSYLSILGDGRNESKTGVSLDRTNPNALKISQPGDDPVQQRHSLYAMPKYQKLSTGRLVKSYRHIAKVERHTSSYILHHLQNCLHVRLIREDDNDADVTSTIPVLSFIHTQISSHDIVQWCLQHGLIIRCGYFLSTALLRAEFDTHNQYMEERGGVVRVSLCHYNNMEDAKAIIHILGTMNGWD